MSFLKKINPFTPENRIPTSVIEVIDSLFIPHWRARKLTDDEIDAKKQRVYQFCMKHPHATKEELFSFMKEISFPKPKVVMN